jgi:microcin C transport system ATP-binding protein
MLFITHDLNIVRQIADRVYVMQNGQVVEHGETQSVFTNPQHAYTQKLLNSEPKGRAVPVPTEASKVLECENLRVWFPIKKGLLRRTCDHVKAVNDISLSVQSGETLGIVGESGSGKTTLGMALLRLISSEGRIIFNNKDIADFNNKQMRPLRKDLQVVFQDPYGALSPRMSVRQIIGEGVRVQTGKDASEEKVAQALTEVDLQPETMHRYPHEFSGGQRQRIAIARALILDPSVIVLDEPTSALDMTVQTQIVDLLRDLQQKKNFTYIFISHDLRVVRALSHRVLVMKNGQVVEGGTTEQIFCAPEQDYTRNLIATASL